MPSKSIFNNFSQINNNYVFFSLALLFEVNLAPSVNKMLSNCDDIIRQHKAACLRVTSLLACKDLIWIGTSAGVILTIPAASCKTTGTIGTYSSVLDQPIVTGKNNKQTNMFFLHENFKCIFFYIQAFLMVTRGM